MLLLLLIKACTTLLLVGLLILKFKHDSRKQNARIFDAFLFRDFILL